MTKFPDLICERVDMCQRGENPFLIEEFEHSYFVIGDHQFYPGYSLLLYKEHVRELHELSEDVHLGLSRELYRANQAIYQAFQPWKVNNMSLGNKDEHVHWHIVPRYEEDPYHNGLPYTDVILGEKKISDYLIEGAEVKRLVDKVRATLGDPLSN